jgi:hypothetical protein
MGSHIQSTPLGLVFRCKGQVQWVVISLSPMLFERFSTRRVGVLSIVALESVGRFSPHPSPFTSPHSLALVWLLVVTFTTPAHALYFGGYELTKRHLRPERPLHDKGAIVHFVSGMVAEVMGALVWTPMDVVKQQLQVQRNAMKLGAATAATTTAVSSIEGLGSFGLITRIAREEGFRGLFRGFVPGVATYGPFVGIYFVAYEECKRGFAWLYDLSPPSEHSPFSSESYTLPFHANLISGAFASATAAGITCPLDTVKTRIQVRSKGADGVVYKGTLDTFKRILREEGWTAFHRGLAARILWIAPGSAITIAACTSSSSSSPSSSLCLFFTLSLSLTLTLLAFFLILDEQLKAIMNTRR